MPDLNEQDITVVGVTNYRGQHRPFGIYTDDRRRHVYVIGKTGVGKSTLLENMVAQDIAAGRGVCFIDPHGDTVEKLLNTIPPSRINDVVYFDPSDVNFPVAFNVLEAVDPAYKYLVASGLVSSLKKIWADSWGPRLEYILRNTILALLDYPGSTILGILRMLADKTYRKKVVEKIQDPVVKSFWTDEFAQYNERFRSEAISPIQNKVGQLLSSAIIRNIMAQSKSTIDMHKIMNEGQILLVNVSKGKVGEDNSALLGALIINRIQLAAMDRASVKEEERKDFYLYVDEFQNFATESFADILSEARKYRLNLTIAHQYITQMEEEVSDAVFGNVGTTIAFRVGAADAEYLEKEFAPVFMQVDLVNLNKYQAYIKLMINGISSKPFSMMTLPPDVENFDKGEIVRQVSRERYGRKREIIEDKVKRWSSTSSDTARANTVSNQPNRQINNIGQTNQTKQYTSLKPGISRPPAVMPARPVIKPGQEQRLTNFKIEATNEVQDLAAVLATPTSSTGSTRSRQIELHPAVCDRCHKNTQVPFKPDPDKKVYCQECLLLVRAEKKKNTPVQADSASTGLSRFAGPKPPTAA